MNLYNEIVKAFGQRGATKQVAMMPIQVCVADLVSIFDHLPNSITSQMLPIVIKQIRGQLGEQTNPGEREHKGRKNDRCAARSIHQCHTPWN